MHGFDFSLCFRLLCFHGLLNTWDLVPSLYFHLSSVPYFARLSFLFQPFIFFFFSSGLQWWQRFPFTTDIRYISITDHGTVVLGVFLLAFLFCDLGGGFFFFQVVVSGSFICGLGW